MKDERNVRHRRTAGGRWRPAAIILAAVLMAVSVPLFGHTAFADPVPGPVNIDRECSLMVKSSASTKQDQALLDQAHVVVDLYMVAEATGDDMYDTYHWEPIALLKEQGLEIPEGLDRAGWRQKTTEVTNLILGSAPEGQTQWNPDEVGSLAKTFSTDKKLTVELGKKTEKPLKAGIYLVIPHGENVTNYCSTNRVAEANENAVTDATAAAAVTDPASSAPTVMLARSSKRTYQFAPELVALPTKAPNEEGEIMTSNRPYEWIYDAEIVLKPAQMGVGGDLEIIKDLSAYEYRKKNKEGGEEKDITDPATFVFEVTAYESAEEGAAQIYHNYVSISFKDASSKSALIKDIPVDSYVVVKEVYSGRSYTATVDTTQTVTIRADQPVGVDFTNDYDDRHGGGGSFTNNFKYEDSGWKSSRVSDNSSESEVVKEFTSTK